MMDRVPTSDDNRWQREIAERLRLLGKPWLSSDPIRLGDLSLPLRPIVGLLALALGLVAVGAVWQEDTETAKHDSLGTASVAMPAHDSRYPSSHDRSFEDYSYGPWYGRGEAAPAPATHQGFRFREDAVAGERPPVYEANRDGYRFRPLNEQERERVHSPARERPFVPDVGERSHYDALSGSYGDGDGFGGQWAPAKRGYSRTW